MDFANRRLGATPRGDSTDFVVWAPLCKRMEIEIVAPVPQRIELQADEFHYFRGTARVGAGARYRVIPDGKSARPDPASRFQPDGVHGDSEVIDPGFDWNDRTWHGLPLRDYIIYELHVGAFTPQGTFDAAIERLDYLRQLGITAIELMPVAQFPGERNWGYDGVFPYAVQNSYGGPVALKRFVNACHARGIACVLDVVYNHLGPEGNYLGEFAPFFTSKYQTPWGRALNVDEAFSDGVRAYFIANALEWVCDYHFDALRLDAVHGILDTSAQPFLAELSDAVHARARELDREVWLIAESDLNDVRMIRPTAQSGMGMDAQWMDDFHHSLHALLTGERAGYYRDYGAIDHMATALRQGFVFTGDYSEFRKRRHGNAPEGARAQQFVVCIQNHDQIGNRMMGERMTRLVGFESLKLAAACVLLSPYIPLVFMGEEYGEEKWFPYFIHHSDEELVAAVRKGRREEFAAFRWQGEPPDPQSPNVFEAATLREIGGVSDEQRTLLDLYRRLIDLRKTCNLGPGRNEQRDVIELRECHAIAVSRLGSFAVFNFSPNAQELSLPLPRGDWRAALSTASQKWRGPGDRLPCNVTSPGSMRLELPATSAILFVSTED